MFVYKKAILLLLVWVTEVFHRMTGELSQLSYLPQPKTNKSAKALVSEALLSARAYAQVVR